MPDMYCAWSTPACECLTLHYHGTGKPKSPVRKAEALFHGVLDSLTPKTDYLKGDFCLNPRNR